MGNFFYVLIDRQKVIKSLLPASKNAENTSVHDRKVNYPADIYMIKVNNRNTRTRWDICSKLTTKTPNRRQWRRSGVFTVNFEHVIAGWVESLKGISAMSNVKRLHHNAFLFSLYFENSYILPFIDVSEICASISVSSGN